MFFLYEGGSPTPDTHHGDRSRRQGAGCLYLNLSQALRRPTVHADIAPTLRDPRHGARGLTSAQQGDRLTEPMDSQTPQAQDLDSESSSPPPTSVIRRRFWSISFLSGFCALICMAVGAQLLRPILGTSAAVDAMAWCLLFVGLGLGAVWWGQRATESGRSIQLLAQWHIGIAIAAALTPWIADVLGSLYPLASGPLGLWVSRLVLIVGILAIPSFWIGGFLPTISQASRPSSDPARRHVAALSAWAILGGAVGLSVIHFWSIEILGLRRTLWLASMLLLLLAMALRNFARTSRPNASEIGSELSEPASSTANAEDSGSWGWLLLAGAGGFVTLLVVQVWRRMLTPLVGDSVFATALVPTLALLGIGLGYLIYHQGASDRKPSYRSLATAFAFLALALILPFALEDWIALGAAFLRPLMVTGFVGLVVSWVMVISVVLLPTSLVVGYIAALWPTLRGQDPRQVGSQLGSVLGCQFLGAAPAAGLYGLGWLPANDISQLWQLLAIGCLSLSLWVLGWELWCRPPSSYKLPLGTLITLMTVCWLVSFPGPSAFWRHTDIGSGHVQAGFKNPHELQGLKHAVGRGILAELDGAKSSVALARDNDLALIVDGRNRGTVHGDAPSQIMGPLIGAALHPEPRNILVLGFGTGATAGWLAQISSVERIDVLEVEPRIVELAGQIEPMHPESLSSPKVKLHIGDGREWLTAHRETYDLIVSWMSDPYRSADSHFFSQDFYRTAFDRLGPGGLFLQPLDGMGIAPETLQGSFATLRSVFPSIEAWQPDTRGLLLIASKAPLLHPMDSTGRRLAREPWRKAMREIWGADGLNALYSAFLANDRLAETLAATSTLEVATDDRPSLSYSFSRRFGYPEAFDFARLRALVDHLVAGLPQLSPDADSAVDWGQALELRASRSLDGILAHAGPWARPASSSDRSSGVQLQGAALARFSARKAWQAGDLPSAHRLWPKMGAQPAAPLFFSDQLMLGELLATGLYERADTDGHILPDPFSDLRTDAPVEAMILEAHLAYSERRIGEATGHLEAAFKLLRQDPWVRLPIVDRGFQLAKKLASFDSISGRALLHALDQPFAAYTFEEVRLATRVNLAGRIHLDDACREIYADYEPHPIWTLRFLQARLQCYQLSEPDPEVEALLRAAERDTRQLLQHNPPKLQLPDQSSAANAAAPETDRGVSAAPDLESAEGDHEP